MMTDLLIKVAIALGSKLFSEAFLAKFLIHSLRAWSNSTPNQWDDKIVSAMAEALDVDEEVLHRVVVEGK